jgi:hypothetical protein
MTQILYRSAPMVRGPVGGACELAYFPVSGAVRILPTADVRMLRVCEEFKSLAEHASAVVAAQCGTDPVAIEKRLMELARNGAFVSEADLLKSCADARMNGSSSSHITWLSIPTSRRLSSLQRCVESYAANLSRFGHGTSIVVADDARCNRAGTECRELLRRLARRTGVAIVYFGQEEKLKFQAQLVAKRACPDDVLSFGLFGSESEAAPTYGANRNAILLGTAGSLVLSADDDTVCRPATVPGLVSPDVLAVRGDTDVTELWFHADRESALGSVAFKDLDIISEHEEVLGHSLSFLIHRAHSRNAVEFKETCSHLVRSLCSCTGRITLTSNGMAGDSAMEFATELPVHPSMATRRRLGSSLQEYERALKSREVVRQAPSRVICHGGSCMATCLGFDNRDILPPFFPLYRNEDGVFGVTVARCLRDAYVGHLPYTLVHAPEDHRAYAFAPFPLTRVSDVVTACVASWRTDHRPERDADRLRSLGTHLKELGSLSQDEFDILVRTLLWSRAAEIINREENLLLRSKHQPSWWRQVVEARIRQLQGRLLEPDYVFPRELIAVSRGNGKLIALRHLIWQFGNLLYWWPDIVEAAKTLEPLERFQQC